MAQRPGPADHVLVGDKRTAGVRFTHGFLDCVHLPSVCFQVGRDRFRCKKRLSTLRALSERLEPIISLPREADGYRRAVSHVHIVHERVNRVVNLAVSTTCSSRTRPRSRWSPARSTGLGGPVPGNAHRAAAWGALAPPGARSRRRLRDRTKLRLRADREQARRWLRPEHFGCMPCKASFIRARLCPRR